MVLDLMYQPRETKLMRDARAAGATDVMNGDLMLVHQTAAAFNLWTGRDVSSTSSRSAWTKSATSSRQFKPQRPPTDGSPLSNSSTGRSTGLPSPAD